MYMVERVILGITWFAALVSLFFIPKGKGTQASFIFLFTQLLTWILGLAVVEVGWLEYPVREFHISNSTSFSYEYLILPIICIFFNLFFPEDKPIRQKLLYYLSFSLGFTLLEVLVVEFTLLIKYNEWKWYWTSISLALLFYLVRVTYKWFFKEKAPFYL